MAFVKISPEAKRQAMDQARAGMSAVDAAKMYGISPKTLRQWLEKDANSSLASTPSPSNNAAPGGAPGNNEQANTTLDFEESPAPVEAKGIVDSALASLKGMLGMDDKATKKATPLLSAKLDPKRQQFVDATAPTFALAAMAIGAWMWGQVGSEYAILAPDEAVAERIVTPLLRVYARHANFLTDIHPDYADIGASLFALVGYVHISLKLYHQIKLEEQLDDEDLSQGQPYRGYQAPAGADVAASRRAYRTASPESESGVSHQGGRHAPLRRASGGRTERNGEHDGDSGNITGLNLSGKEAAQYEALSRLSRLDYEHRARRAGRPA